MPSAHSAPGPLTAATLEFALRRVADPLPGARPHDNARPIRIQAKHDGWELAKVLGERFPQVSMAEWARRAATGSFRRPNGTHCAIHERVRAGESIDQIFPDEIEPPVAVDLKVLYLDDELVALHKPAPLPMHPSGRFHRNTLQFLLDLAMAPDRLRPLHRLDANTTGVVLFARSRAYAKQMQTGFLDRSVTKCYRTRVIGHPHDDQFAVDVPIAKLPGPAGIRLPDPAAGSPARSDFSVLERSSDGSALLEVVLTTGRTNQIRIHLWQLGMPVLGDPTYLPGHQVAARQTLRLGEPAMRLHAWRIGIHHPRDGRLLEITAPMPTGF